MPLKNLLTATFALGAMLAPLSQAIAQAWPEKTVTIVVATAAGGANDAIARIIAQHDQHPAGLDEGRKTRIAAADCGSCPGVGAADRAGCLQPAVRSGASR